MYIKKTKLFILAAVILLVMSVLVFFAATQYFSPKTLSLNTLNTPSVLGKMLEKTNLINSIPPTSTPVPLPTPTIWEHTVLIMNSPADLTEGDNASFTWSVTGPSTVINTSTIYLGRKSTPEALGFLNAPENTEYTDSLKDFAQGIYKVPIQFVANKIMKIPGTYYFRGYAFVEGKHIWTDEKTFTVKAIPKHEIKIVNQPTTINHDKNITFTWDIYGPPATTMFTAIVAGKESRPGPLEKNVDTTMMPYKFIVNDFINVQSKVPLRFIGNSQPLEPGTYYFRAVAFINDKNIWSDEYSFKVE